MPRPFHATGCSSMSLATSLAPILTIAGSWLGPRTRRPASAATRRGLFTDSRNAFKSRLRHARITSERQMRTSRIANALGHGSRPSRDRSHRQGVSLFQDCTSKETPPWHKRFQFDRRPRRSLTCSSISPPFASRAEAARRGDPEWAVGIHTANLRRILAGGRQVGDSILVANREISQRIPSRDREGAAPRSCLPNLSK
jgi:hypothetical protein